MSSLGHVCRDVSGNEKLSQLLGGNLWVIQGVLMEVAKSLCSY